MNPSPGLSTHSSGSSGTHMFTEQDSISHSANEIKSSKVSCAVCPSCVTLRKYWPSLSFIQCCGSLVDAVLCIPVRSMCDVMTAASSQASCFCLMSAGPSNAHTPARPSSTSSTGSRGRWGMMKQKKTQTCLCWWKFWDVTEQLLCGVKVKGLCWTVELCEDVKGFKGVLCYFSCSSAGRANAGAGTAVEQVKVKQEPGTEDSYSCPTSSLKTERGKDARSACMVGALLSMIQRNCRLCECGLRIVHTGVTEHWEC